jgi:hypothetical protein
LLQFRQNQRPGFHIAGMMARLVLASVLSATAQAGCGGSLALSHTKTACLTPGQTTDVSGKAAVTWRLPTQLSTTTLLIIVTAKPGDQRTSRDIHVVVGGNGRSCYEGQAGC